MPEETLFLDIFGCCAPHAELCGGLNGAKVRSVTVSREERSMDVEASFAHPPASGELTLLENCLAEEYGLRDVRIRADRRRRRAGRRKANRFSAKYPNPPPDRRYGI